MINIIKKIPYTVKMFLIGLMGYLVIRFLGLSMKIKLVHEERLHHLRIGEGQRVLYCFWHDRLLMMPFIALGQKALVLISQHRDGEYISRVISWFGFRSIRGSSTRGGTMALRKMARVIHSGWHGAITPDGPRGPRHKVKEGVILLASLTGAPVLPIAFNCSKKKTFQPGTGF
jgi:lysophospholipid acyltransferase (LPLAT)-like uncharacterized protein